MSFLWPTASQILVRASKPSPIWNSFRVCASHLDGHRPRNCTTHLERSLSPGHIDKQTTSLLGFASLRSYATQSKRSPRRAVSSLKPRASPSTHSNRPVRIITTYEDLPEDYNDEQGLRFRLADLSDKETASIFGSGTIDNGHANYLMRVLHGRRVAGTLADPAMPMRAKDAQLEGMALTWLRANVPVDEDDSAGQRAEMELAAMEADILADSERLGLYKPNAGEPSSEGNNFHPKSVYGRSGLDEIREAAEQRRSAEIEAEEARQRQADEIRQNTGTLTTQTARERAQIELRRPGDNAHLKKYLAAAAAVVPDVPPEMGFVQRLWPSALVALLVIGGSVLFTQIYVPPSHSARLWQDMPPAAATIITLICANSLIWILWHFPPAFATLNKYFLSVPGYPRALAVLGNVFSHQTVGHLAMNMIMLWLMGTRLHDDIGRANFIALYLSAGVTSSFFSLTMFTLRKNFVTHSLGASGAISAVVACYLWLHSNEYFKILMLPPDPYKGVPGWFILSSLLAMELITKAKSRKMGPKFDHFAHLGGYATGIAGAELFDRSMKRKREAEREKRRKMSVVEKMTSWGK